MEKILINPVSIFESVEGVYISRGDHSLVNVRGKDSSMVANVIKEFRNQDTAENVYEILKEKYGIDETYYNKILNWLLSNRIVERSKEQQESKTKSLSIIGHFGNDKNLVKKLFEHLNLESHEFDYELHDFIDANSLDENFTPNKESDVILYFSPIFEDYEQFKKISKKLYQSKVNCLHVGIDEHTYTLGPFVIPSQKTPCLKCYSQRKIANMSNPEEYVKFTSLYSIDKITGFSVTQMPHFGLVIQHLKLLLDDYFRVHRSELTAKSLVVDLYDNENRVSRILRVPTCDVCCSTDNVFAPFN